MTKRSKLAVAVLASVTLGPAILLGPETAAGGAGETRGAALPANLVPTACTAAERPHRVAALAAFVGTAPARRRAFFAKNTSASARTAFLTRERAKLRRLRAAVAGCRGPGTGEYFRTLPVGAALPRPDAECARRVTRHPWEPRPENGAANRRVPTAPVPWNNTRRWTYWKPFIAKRNNVTGNFTGTTDEIIQWAACKWGFNENVMRAVAVQESHWRQSQLGDYENGRYHSFGLMQIRHDDAQGALVKGGHPATQRYTALNVDYYGAEMRGCLEGDFYDGGPWLYGGKKVTGDLWGCVGYWYSGNWYTAAAKDYIANVRTHYKSKPWVGWGYRGK